jgi:ankyrin repeat protein
VSKDDHSEQRIAGLDRENRRHLAPWLERGGTQAAFLSACITADLDSARRLLNEDPSLVNVPSGEVTPVRLAVFYGCSELAGLLIRYGAALNTPASERMDYPLHLAAAFGHSDVIRVLVAHGAEVDARDKDEETPLHRAAKMNHKEAIQLLIEGESRSAFGQHSVAARDL